MRIRSKERKMLAVFWMVSLLCISFTGFAQVAGITGKVIGADDRLGIPGASVTVKGTATSTATDANGNFTIRAKVGDVLVFTSIGYVPAESKVAGTGPVSITLATSRSNLNEVVVIGYGTQKRKDLTGSIASISSKELATAQATTFDQALQGRVAGVMVQSASGQPGGAASVTIRGLGTLLANKDPLYVIDGVIIPPNFNSSTGGVYLGNNQLNTNPLSTISPADIASIDVLKDASAIAIYGSQGSAGVVVITTKRGKAGAPRINFDGYYGTQRVYKQIPMLNLREYAEFVNTRTAIQGGEPRADFVNPQYLGEGSNWQKELFKSAATYTGNLSISGGDERTQYLIGGNYFNQDGLIVGSDFKRQSFKLNLDNQTTRWLKIGNSLTISNVKENVNSSQYNVVGSALGLTPDIAIQNPDGSITFPPDFVGNYNPNPIAAASLNTNTLGRTQIFGNLYAEVKILEGLTLRNEYSLNMDYGNVDQFTPSLLINTSKTQSRSFVQATNNKSYTFRNFLTYDRTVFSDLNLNLLLGHEASTGKYTYLSGSRTGFVANNPQGLSLGDAKTATNGGGYSDYANEAYFSRLNLNYRGKYLLTANVRNDGNSNFAPGNRWVVTYGFAGAWDIAKENFLLNNKIIDQAKLRLGYGLTNNANIPGYSYGAAVSLQTVGLGQGARVTNIANPDVKWETTKGYNIGVDLGFLKNRIQLTADAYYRKTQNLLMVAPLPLYAGITGTGQLNAPTVNIGSIENKGLEFALNTKNILQKDFTWSSTITATIGNTKILSLNDMNAYLTGIIDNGQISVTRTAVNGGIGSFFGYISEGVYRDGADLTNSPKPANQTIDPRNGVWVGDTKLKDLNKDGVIDQNDQTYLGSPIPKMQYGFNNNFTYKNFDLTIFFNGNYGNKILNYEKVKHQDPNGGTHYFTSTLDYAKLALVDPNGSATDANNIYVTNPGTLIPAIRIAGNPATNTSLSNRFIEDGSYLRLKNINLGYKLPQNLLTKYKISSLRVFASCTNLFTITNYSGFDPEIGSALPSSNGTNSLTTGIDWGHYPAPRIYTFGFNLGL
ncbi:TonB-dependent receptor [Mucilaginibacter sp. UR6-1]|uniref:SusC/RagA family TonB-linked outer membrane protein n=1 Tax=Mucilaginibacter sp. UR6-1 TaxID=1435643 RepID=UPI001E3D6A32|nr:TonB-dependent receptor [Mucilaginibacter sp. UR6-1]MCC8408578.1 TonB-dependent receptor [Mucilaginibacter sp. UR6-1]